MFLPAAENDIGHPLYTDLYAVFCLVNLSRSPSIFLPFLLDGLHIYSQLTPCGPCGQCNFKLFTSRLFHITSFLVLVLWSCFSFLGQRMLLWIQSVLPGGRCGEFLIPQERGSSTTLVLSNKASQGHSFKFCIVLMNCIHLKQYVLTYIFF